MEKISEYEGYRRLAIEMFRSAYRDKDYAWDSPYCEMRLLCCDLLGIDPSLPMTVIDYEVQKNRKKEKVYHQKPASPEVKKKMLEMRKKGMLIKDIAEATKFSTTSVLKYIRELE